MTFNRPDTDKLHELIDKYSFEKYYVVNRGFQANHMGHGQVALFRMGDSLEHIEEWSKFYSSQIEPKDGESKQKDDAKVEGPVSFEDLRGKKSHYYFILDHYKTLLATTYEGNLDDFIAAEFPKLHLGIGKYAVHPLIHIGYGYSVKSATLVCEGFAWLHYTYLPLILSSYSTDQLGKGTKSFVEIAELIQADDDLFNKVIKEVDEPWIKNIPIIPPFRRRMMAMLTKFGDELLKYVHMLECPRDPEELMNWIVDHSIVLYQMVENRNDFFILHGVTSAWALANFLHLIKPAELKLEVLQNFLCILLVVYIGKDRPKLNPEYLVTPDVSNVTWDNILGRTINLPLEADEHEHKVVQICYEASLRNPEKSDLYKRACFTVHDFEYHIRSGSETVKKPDAGKF